MAVKMALKSDILLISEIKIPFFGKFNFEQTLNTLTSEELFFFINKYFWKLIGVFFF